MLVLRCLLILLVFLVGSVQAELAVDVTESFLTVNEPETITLHHMAIVGFKPKVWATFRWNRDGLNWEILAAGLETSASILPDTNQTASYTNTFGEDADYSSPAPVLIDNGDGTITDERSGLTWQQVNDEIERSWDEAVQYCENLSIGCRSDWRLPSVTEAATVVDYGIHAPAIDAAFQISPVDIFWLSTALAGDSTSAWMWFTSNGSFDGRPPESAKSTLHRALCVSGGSLYRGAFLNNGNGTVSDLATGLIWEQGDAAVLGWEAALARCESLSLAGREDWRVPNIRELRSLLDYSSSPSTLDLDLFAFEGGILLSSTTQWSSSFDRVYAVDPYNGFRISYLKTSDSSTTFVRCVRDLN